MSKGLIKLICMIVVFSLISARITDIRFFVEDKMNSIMSEQLGGSLDDMLSTLTDSINISN